MKVRYFDHAATTPLKSEVFEQMKPFFTYSFGNASSVYQLGRASKAAVENSRGIISRVLNCNPKELYFTSCGSESDNLAIKGVMLANKERGRHIITSKIEHPAVLNSCKWLERMGFDVSYVGTDEFGKVNIEELKKEIRPDTILISIMFANNEIGTIQNIKEIGMLAKNRGVYFHTDAVQAVGNCRIDVKKMGIDLLSMSAHKFYGPKGVGGLYVGENVKIMRMQDGGHQESGRRSGTENVAGIVGMGAALKLIDDNFESYNKKLMDLRSYFWKQISYRVQNVKLNGDPTNRLPGNCNISFKDVNASELLKELDYYGICASAGSACTAASSEPSHVLMAIGLEEEFINGALRVTFGLDNTFEDVDFLVEKIVDFLRVA